MSGSHYQPEPPSDGRYSLEDTIYEMPPVIKGYAHREHVLSGAFYPGKPPAIDGDDYTFAHEAAIPAEPAASGLMTLEFRHTPDRTCDVWPETVERRLAALEAAVGALAAMVTGREGQ